MNHEHRASGTALLLLAAATGARSMLGLAALSGELAERAAATPLLQPAQLLRAPNARAALNAFAAMELVGDMLPFIPDRTAPGPLAGRMAAGAMIGSAVHASAGQNRVAGAIIGAATAWGAAHATFHLRRVLSDRMHPALAAVVEDAIMIVAAVAGADAVPGSAG